MKIDLEKFEIAINKINENIEKFDLAIAEIDSKENEKIISASKYFYQNLQEIVLPLRAELKNKIIQSINEKKYGDIQGLIDCIKKLDETIVNIEKKFNERE